MPYDSVQDLPDTVRNVLPIEAQRIWLSAYNSADADEEEARAGIAWAAVENAGWEKVNDKWVKKEKVKKSLPDLLMAFHDAAMELLPDWMAQKIQERMEHYLMENKQLTPGDVHVPAPFEIDMDELDTQLMKGKGKRPKQADDIDDPPVQKSLVASFIKADEEKQIVTGVVLEPDTVDAQGDTISAEEIERAAHKFLVQSRIVGKQHKGLAKAEVVESYIAPKDMVLGQGNVTKGTWIMSVKVHDQNLWEEVKNGSITGFSIGAFGVREPAG